MKINYKKLLIFILIPLILGAIVAFLTIPNNDVDSIIPSWIFPVVWTILYILMGISSYLVYRDSNKIPRIYIVQLIFNLLWSFVFFKFKLYTIAFIWILILIVLVIIMIKEFNKINKLSSYLQIPYIIWLIVASVLNITFII